MSIPHTSIQLITYFVNFRITTPKRISRQESEIKLPAQQQNAAKLIEKEESQVGSVNMGVYIRYIKSIGLIAFAITIFSSIANQVFAIWSSVWLTTWSDDVDSQLPHLRDLYLGVYGVFGVLQTVAVLGTSIALAIGCLYAARDIHNNLLNQTLRLPMSFFDTTPLGRIVNKYVRGVL